MRVQEAPMSRNTFTSRVVELSTHHHRRVYIWALVAGADSFVTDLMKSATALFDPPNSAASPEPFYNAGDSSQGRLRYPARRVRIASVSTRPGRYSRQDFPCTTTDSSRRMTRSRSASSKHVEGAHGRGAILRVILCSRNRCPLPSMPRYANRQPLTVRRQASWDPPTANPVFRVARPQGAAVGRPY